MTYAPPTVEQLELAMSVLTGLAAIATFVGLAVAVLALRRGIDD